MIGYNYNQSSFLWTKNQTKNPNKLIINTIICINNDIINQYNYVSTENCNYISKIKNVYFISNNYEIVNKKARKIRACFLMER